MSHGTEDYSERKEIRAYEIGMSSRSHVPFSKFDPRSKTAQHIHRTAGGESDVEGLLPQNSYQPHNWHSFQSKCIVRH